MKVFWNLGNGDVSLVAEVPDGAMDICPGYMADVDDYVDAISWDTKEYRTRSKGWLPFPDKWYRKEDLTWQIYRVGVRFYE